MPFIIRLTATVLHGRRSLKGWRSLPATLLLATTPALALAQQSSTTGQSANPSIAPISLSASADAELDSLLIVALTRSPLIRAATARVAGAKHRVAAESAPPDPMLMAGIVNQPLAKEASVMAENGSTASGPDPMTMRMIGLSQTFVYPGKLALRRRVAEGEAESARVAVETARRLVIRDVKQAYYELAFIEQARQVVDRNRDVLASVIRVTDARYGLGTVEQSEVLKARLDGTRLAEMASDLSEQRSAALARLNGLLDQPVDTTALRPAIPARIARLATPAASEDIRFMSNALGSRAAGSPLPPLSTLQDAAVANSSEMREHQTMIGAQAARVDLARREGSPDIDLAVQYGQRSGGLPDMVSASVSIPLPIFSRRKQGQLTADASAQLEALQADHQAAANAIRVEVASLVADIERERTQLALYAKALLPQGRAMLNSATASYQVGKGQLRDVLDAQASLFSYETDNARSLTDFAKQMAELERIVGTEVVR